MTGTAEGRLPCPSLSLWPPSVAFGRRVRRLRLRGFRLQGCPSWTRRHPGRRGAPAVCEPPTRGTPQSNCHHFTTPCRGIPEHEKAKVKILEYLQKFENVFSKETFDMLPPQKPWDHAIELEPGSKPTNCKVYLLSPKEQVELDAFLKENLCTRRIHPSKSPMASPVFFIKKKDGLLQLIQDY